MIKLAKYLKSSAGFVLLIFFMLFLQAYCDLSLPDYTSRIINVGIQQRGIEDGVPEKLRADTADQLLLFMDEDEAALFEDSYDQGETWVLKDSVGTEEREALGDAMGTAELAYMAFSEGGEAEEALKSQMQIPEGVSVLELLAQARKSCGSRLQKR